MVCKEDIMKKKKVAIVGKPTTVQEILKRMELEQKQEPRPTPKSSVTGDPYSLLYTVAKTVNNGDDFVGSITSERKINRVERHIIKKYNSTALSGGSTTDVVTSSTAVGLLERDDKEKDM